MGGKSGVNIEKRPQTTTKRKEFEVSMLDILLQSTDDFNTLEETVMKIAKNLMETCLEILDEELFKNKPEHLEMLNFKERTIVTKIGEIQFKRRYYKDHKANNNLHLLDKKLGLRERKRVNGGYLKLLVSLADKLSYRGVEEAIKDTGLPELSHGTIFNEVRKFGEEESERIKEEKEKIYSDGNIDVDQKQKNPDILFLEADGVVVSSQERDKKRMEIKLGLVHEGWEFETPSKKRKKLVNPSVVAGVYDSADDFWEEFSAEIAKRYDLTETLVVLNGDGARWIQESSKKHFTDIIVQLDRFHIKRDITRYFNKEIAEGMYKLLQEGKKKTFLDTLESLISEGETAKNRRDRKRLVKHFKKYEQHLIDYRQRLPKELKKKNKKLYGLGAVESYIDKVIARRMKNQGMSWSKKGAEAMAKILMLKQIGKLKARLSDINHIIKNPIKELKNKKKAIKKNIDNSWLKGELAALKGPCSGKSWTKGLRNLATI